MAYTYTFESDLEIIASSTSIADFCGLNGSYHAAVHRREVYSGSGASTLSKIIDNFTFDNDRPRVLSAIDAAFKSNFNFAQKTALECKEPRARSDALVAVSMIATAKSADSDFIYNTLGLALAAANESEDHFCHENVAIALRLAGYDPAKSFDTARELIPHYFSKYTNPDSETAFCYRDLAVYENMMGVDPVKTALAYSELDASSNLSIYWNDTKRVYGERISVVGELLLLSRLMREHGHSELEKKLLNRADEFAHSFETPHFYVSALLEVAVAKKVILSIIPFSILDEVFEFATNRHKHLEFYSRTRVLFQLAEAQHKIGESPLKSFDAAVELVLDAIEHGEERTHEHRQWRANISAYEVELRLLEIAEKAAKLGYAQKASEILGHVKNADKNEWVDKQVQELKAEIAKALAPNSALSHTMQPRAPGDALPPRTNATPRPI